MYLNDVLAAPHLQSPGLLAALGPVLLRVVVGDTVRCNLMALINNPSYASKQNTSLSSVADQDPPGSSGSRSVMT